ncbi:MAG: YbgC/FadM family acyl-CoA thioesterase [Gammaproteobacteria bacterium]|nr:YbgC/FadM family acyl-CoA thioesterase [Gammaproteobacteria bacterium]
MARCSLPIRVYLEDTDAQGIVYNASYFRFLERARTDWLRACGIDHSKLLADAGIALVLASIDARFRAPARLDDMLHVAAELQELKGARAVFAQQIRRGAPDGDVVADATAVVACVDAATGTARRWPQELARRLRAER